MPIIQIHLLEGRSTEQKIEMVRRVTDAVADSLDEPDTSVRIILNEMAPDGFAHAGVLASRKPG
ncbi:2-hydroxymuconate tautomerase family protein [Parasphingopyxis algicola]|nr:2-hydroxymuconate tautomerase [Parasphingopyxis algicola]QLC27023.1 2-hydroxymuconate tautomerase family protein [Parasphingopyxis algicola]